MQRLVSNFCSLLQTASRAAAKDSCAVSFTRTPNQTLLPPICCNDRFCVLLRCDSLQLKMTVCIPFLWGVPPEVDALSDAIASAGGIVDRVYKQWGIYRPQFVRAAQQQYTDFAARRRDSSKDIWC